MHRLSWLPIALLALGASSCAPRQDTKKITSIESQLRFYTRNDQGGAKIEMRVAELEAREGTTKAVVERTELEVFLYPEVLLRGTDIKTAQVAVFEQHGWGVMVEFTPQGAERLRDVTTKNVGKMLVLVVEERVVMAAKIGKPVPDGKVAITGKYTSEEADRLARQITGR
jgi:preprotein translocase subunit SecD